MSSRLFLAAAGAALVVGMVDVAIARADDVPAATKLRVKGEGLAKAGRYTEAIEAFKGADALQPRARHACLIALAYARRELWPQAEIFLDVCHQRSSPADPLPAWVAKEDTEISARLAAANVAPVTLVLDPPDPRATLTVSSFLPDEAFPPRTIHLAPGHYIAVAHAPDGAEVRQTFDVVDREPLRVAIAMHAAAPEATRPAPLAPASTPPPPLPVTATAHARPHAHALSYAVGGAGLAIAIAGLVYQETAFSSIDDQLKHDTAMAYPHDSSTWDVREHTTQALYGVGAAAVVAGVILRLTVERDAAVTVETRPGGGVISLAWRR